MKEPESNNNHKFVASYQCVRWCVACGINMTSETDDGPCPPWAASSQTKGSTHSQNHHQVLQQVYDHMASAYVFGGEGKHFQAGGQTMKAMDLLESVLESIEKAPLIG